MELHQVIRAAREDAGLTLTEAAERLGVGKATLSRLETKKGPITATRLAEIAKLYGVSPSDLLDGTVTATTSGEMDYEQVGTVVEAVHQIIRDNDIRPSPGKVRIAVVEILKLAQADLQAKHDGVFDVHRYQSLAKALLG